MEYTPTHTGILAKTPSRGNHFDIDLFIFTTRLDWSDEKMKAEMCRLTKVGT
jgi:hypothetical protein